MESVQQQLEVSLEHSLTQGLGKHCMETVNKERRERGINVIGNTRDSVVTVQHKNMFCGIHFESFLSVSLMTYLGTLFQ